MYQLRNSSNIYSLINVYSVKDFIHIFNKAHKTATVFTYWPDPNDVTGKKQLLCQRFKCNQIDDDSTAAYKLFYFRGQGITSLITQPCNEVRLYDTSNGNGYLMCFESMEVWVFL